MSILKRRILTIFFILLFLVLAPMIIFYANGNILGEGWSILATGGIFINSMESGAELFVNGKLKDTTGFFTRGYFLKNLKPGIYTILVKKDNYNDWANKIKVYANQVTESSVFMLPTEIDITEIKEFLETEKAVGTTTVKTSKPNPDYEMVKNLFTTKYATGTEANPIKNRHLSIWKEGRDAFISWDDSVDSSPKIFCEESADGIKCQSQLKIYSFESAIGSLDFFPGESEVIMASAGDKIYAVEAEANPDKKPQILYSGEKPDFQIFNNIIYIKDGNFFGQAEI